MSEVEEFWILKDAIGHTQDFLTWEPTRHTSSDFVHVVDKRKLVESENVTRLRDADLLELRKTIGTLRDKVSELEQHLLNASDLQSKTIELAVKHKNAADKLQSSLSSANGRLEELEKEKSELNAEYERLYTSVEKQCSIHYFELVDMLKVPPLGSVIHAVEKLQSSLESAREVIEHYCTDRNLYLETQENGGTAIYESKDLDPYGKRAREWMKGNQNVAKD